MPEQQRQCNTVTPTHEGTYVATDCCKRCSAVHGGVKFTTTKLRENRQTCTYVNNLWKSHWMAGGEQTDTDIPWKKEELIVLCHCTKMCVMDACGGCASLAAL